MSQQTNHGYLVFTLESHEPQIRTAMLLNPLSDQDYLDDPEQLKQVFDEPNPSFLLTIVSNPTRENISRTIERIESTLESAPVHKVPWITQLP